MYVAVDSSSLLVADESPVSRSMSPVKAVVTSVATSKKASNKSPQQSSSTSPVRVAAAVNKSNKSPGPTSSSTSKKSLKE